MQAWDRRSQLAERPPSTPTEPMRVNRALQLIADGKIGRAQAMLLSEGDPQEHEPVGTREATQQAAEEDHKHANDPPRK